MSLVSGAILEIYIEDGITMAKVNVKGAFVRVPVLLLPQASVGDVILVDSGVAISRVEELTKEET
jgi:hydrogenase maturation factor